MATDPDFTRISTDRLVIRQFGSQDIDAFVAYRSDPDVARYQTWETSTRTEAAAFVGDMTEIHPGIPGRWYQFAVADPTTDALLGDTAFIVDPDDPSHGEIGFTFSPAQRGRGYATEAVRATIDYGFDVLDVEVVAGVTDVRNAPSIALLERIGMTHVSTAHVRFKGEWCDERTYELNRGELRRG